MTTMLNIADLAARLDTDARTTRKFLRSITPADEQPGKGSRWQVPAKKVQSLKSQFKKYQTEVQNAKSETQDITTEDATSEVITDEVLTD